MKYFFVDDRISIFTDLRLIVLPTVNQKLTIVDTENVVFCRNFALEIEGI